MMTFGLNALLTRLNAIVKDTIGLHGLQEASPTSGVKGNYGSSSCKAAMIDIQDAYV